MIIWIASYPRSGNTLCRIILKEAFDHYSYSIFNDKKDIGSDEATREAVGHQFLPDAWDKQYPALQQTPDTVFVKTHLPPFDDGKAIYVVRDPRDVLASYYHYFQAYKNIRLDIQEFIKGKAGFGGWGNHLDAWQPLTRPSTLLVKYEDLVGNPGREIGRISQFCGIEPVKTWVNDFEKYRSINPKFFRKGVVGGHETEMGNKEIELLWSYCGDWMRRLGYGQGTAEIMQQGYEAAVARARQMERRALIAEAELANLNTSTLVRVGRKIRCIQKLPESRFQKYIKHRVAG